MAKRVDLGKIIPEKGVDYYTEAEKNQIEDEITDRLVGLYKRYESRYITISANEDTIPINIRTYDENCILEVYIEGRIIDTSEYEVSQDNESITLTTPLSEVGTIVQFVVYKFYQVDSEDYDILKGEPGELQLSDIEDNLNSNSSIKILSAKQGKVLNDTKADIQTVTNLQTQLNAVASGSPAGVYSTVSALTTADPDHSKIYLVSADGHWYYYANSQWNDGGPYQSTEIAENSIKTNHIKDSNVSANKIIDSINYISYANEIKKNTELVGFDPETKLPIYQTNSNFSVAIIDIEEMAQISWSWFASLPLSAGNYYVRYNKDALITPVNVRVNDIINAGVNWYDPETGLAWLGNIFNHLGTDNKMNRLAIQFNNNEEFITNLEINNFDKKVFNKIDINFNKKENDSKYINLLQFAYRIDKCKSIIGYDTTTYYPILDVDRNCDIYYFNVKDIAEEYLGNLYYHIATSVFNDINKIIYFTPYSKAYNITKSTMTGSNRYNPLTGDFKLWDESFTVQYEQIAIQINHNDETKSFYSYKMPELLTSISMFNSIGAVGDSYTAGDTMNSENEWVHLPNQSYPNVMAKRAGIICNNFAKGGATTRSYLTTENYQSLLNTPGNDFYFIAFGINDSEQLGNNYLGTIEDIKEDYTQNADTFYGNYGKIISSILNHKADAKLCLILIPLEESNTQNFNNAIINIANHFAIPYINPFDDIFFKTRLYESKSGGHPTAMGYVGMALAYERLFSKCVIKNINYFKYSLIN